MDDAGVYSNWESMAYLSLCNLIVMVRKLKVHPPCVDVSLLAQDVTSGREVVVRGHHPTSATGEITVLTMP